MMTSPPTLRIGLVSAIMLAAWCVGVLAQPPADKVDAAHSAKMAHGLQIFKQYIRPVLAESCLKCHGGKETKAGLDLSDREPLLKGGDSGPAILIDHAADSLLIKLLRHEKEPKMPKGAARLPEATVQHFVEWIESGAPYDKPLIEKADPKAWIHKKVSEEAKQHWAYQPLKRVEPPKVKDVAWCRTPIDAFIRAKQEAAGVVPNGPAERRVLIRRAYFDLIGLPPTPAEVEGFVNDRSPEAWEKVLDHLLDSPHYGERWGRHWLDLVRFAESHGFEHDYDRPTAYHYRDFVIQALNKDLPFDTFVKWQLAGDEFAPDNPLAWMATGYLAAGVHSTQITKNEVERQRYDELDDILATTGTAFLGLTVGCCRCHDHKYDPFPQADYYRMLSTFTTTVRSEFDINLDPNGYRKALADYEKEHAPLAHNLEQFEKEQLPSHFAAWEKSHPALPPGWLVPDIQSMKSAGGATLMKQDDGSVLITGTNPNTETLTFTLRTDTVGLRAIRIEALTHPSLVKNGPGRATNGNFALTDFRITAAPASDPKKAMPVKLQKPRATFEQKGLPAASAIADGAKKPGWAIDPQFGKGHAAAFEFESPVGLPGGTILTVTMAFNNNVGHGMGRPRLSLATSAGLSLTAAAELESIKRSLEIAADKRTPEQQAALLKWYRKLDPQWQALNAKVQDHARHQPHPNTVKALVGSEGLPAVRLHTQGDDFLPATHFLRRGDADQKDAVAPMGFLQVLMTAPESEKHWERTPPPGSRTSYRRTAFAEWMTDVDEGAGRLLARVIVNRLWQHHLGRGIVATPSDFGSRGEPPTHPELLDWLATELIARGWRFKPLHKLIMSSAVYMQSSAGNDDLVRRPGDGAGLVREPDDNTSRKADHDGSAGVMGESHDYEDQRNSSIAAAERRPMVAQGGGSAEPWDTANPKGPSPGGATDSFAPPGLRVALPTLSQGSAEPPPWATIGRRSAAAIPESSRYLSSLDPTTATASRTKAVRSIANTVPNRTKVTISGGTTFADPDSDTIPDRTKLDRENKLFWHQTVRRLEAEAIRDNLLAIGGMLDPTMLGPGTLDESNRRRSIYFTVKRSKLIGMLVVFDAPDGLVGLADRPATTIAPQALMLMNNPHVRDWAKAFARRVAPSDATPLDSAIRSAYAIALARSPSSDELADARTFIAAQTDVYLKSAKPNARELALIDYCQAVMCLNECIFVE